MVKDWNRKTQRGNPKTENPIDWTSVDRGRLSHFIIKIPSFHFWIVHLMVSNSSDNDFKSSTETYQSRISTVYRTIFRTLEMID